jgi:hypothetical protein
MPEIPAPTDHTRPKSQPQVGSLLRGGSHEGKQQHSLGQLEGASLSGAPPLRAASVRQMGGNAGRIETLLRRFHLRPT